MNTIGLRLDIEEASIDIDRVIDIASLEQVESYANKVIYENNPVPTMEEIERYSKRKPPETDEDIRIVKIGDLDYTPCCGTHNKSISEVGMIKVLHSEQTKNGMRIYFTCGSSALQRFKKPPTIMEELKEELSCSTDEVLSGIQQFGNGEVRAREGFGSCY